MSNLSYKNKYLKYKQKYLDLKHKLIQYAGNTIDDDIATFTILSNDQTLTEAQRMQNITILSVLQSIKDSSNIQFLTETCGNEDNHSVSFHCKNKISGLVQHDILSSDNTLDQTIDILTVLQFKTDELNIVLAKLLRLRNTDFTVEINIQELVQSIDYESNPIVRKYIEKRVEELFASEQQQGLESKEGSSAAVAASAAPVDVSFSNIGETIDALVPLLLQVNDRVTACLAVTFPDSASVNSKILASAQATSYPIVVPFLRDPSKYKSPDDYNMIKNRGYHKYGHRGDYELLEFYFRNFLFSSVMFFALPIVKSSSSYALMPRSIHAYFANDIVFSKFFNYILNSTEFGTTIKEIAMVYQQLKIYEEKDGKHNDKLEMSLSLLNTITIGSIFLICDSLAKRGKLRIPQIDEEFDIDAEYTQVVDLAEGISEERVVCRELFTTDIDSIKRIKAILHYSYRFLDVDSPF